jgi:hypothetical protein
MSLLFSMFGLLLGLGGAVASAGSSVGSATQWVPPDDTIVKVEGNKYDGFGLFYYDGSSLFPPTDSEALAECEEYDTRIAVVRCRTEVRIWYRDLAQLRRALRYAHSSPQ